MNCIYKITNLTNGKTYIGQHHTNNLNDAYLGGGILIRKAVKKYGKESFSKEIIISGDFTQNQIDMFEKCAISMERLNGKAEYNIANGGNGVGKHSNEAREKISNASRNRSEEIIRKISESLKGRDAWNKGKECGPLSEETKQKLSDALSGEKNPFYGKHHTDETKRKLSEKAKNISLETRRKMSEAKIGKHPSEESRKKMSNATKGENNGFYGKHHTEEANEKNRQSHLGQKYTAEKAAAYKEYKLKITN